MSYSPHIMHKKENEYFGEERIVKKRIKHATISICCIILVLSAAFIYSGLEDSIAVDKSGESVVILMYHSVLKDSNRADEYIIPLDVFEEDLLYLKNNGYTTVHINDLIAYVYDGVLLPQKPVVITFDDGHYNNMTYVLPLLEQYDMKASISIVGEFSDASQKSGDKNPNYAYVSWEDVMTLSASKHIEIINHSYFMHKLDKRPGAAKKPNESEAAYREAFTSDTLLMQSQLQKLGVTPLAYAYPYGKYSSQSEEILKEIGFLCTLTCREHKNTLISPESLFGLGRYNRDGRLSTMEFMMQIGV